MNDHFWKDLNSFKNSYYIFNIHGMNQTIQSNSFYIRLYMYLWCKCANQGIVCKYFSEFLDNPESHSFNRATNTEFFYCIMSLYKPKQTLNLTFDSSLFLLTIFIMLSKCFLSNSFLGSIPEDLEERRIMSQY